MINLAFGIIMPLIGVTMCAACAAAKIPLTDLLPDPATLFRALAYLILTTYVPEISLFLCGGVYGKESSAVP
jgi:TRAP-type C4-dicarboxylate transport system permease large subunit